MRFRVNKVVLRRAYDEPTIELGQHLRVTTQSVERRPLKDGRVSVVIHGAAEISQFVPEYTTRVDGIPQADCKNLQARFGPNFPSLIASNPSILDQARFSAGKIDVIIKACQWDLKCGTPSSDKAYRKLVRELSAAGETKARARRLAGTFDETGSPFQFFLRNEQTFLRASRFAQLHDPERAAIDRPLLYVAAMFVGVRHTVTQIHDIEDTCWTDFGCDASETENALTRLIDLQLVRKIEQTIDAPGGPIVGEIGERVLLPDFGCHHLGVISVVTAARVPTEIRAGPSRREAGTKGWDGEKREPEVRANISFDDGDVAEIDLKYLREPSTRVRTWFGLNRLVKAEELIAALLSTNPAKELTPAEMAIIEYVLDHAAEILRRPGFILDDAQRRAIIQAFRYRFSIVTGPPGVGKTAIAALICAVAARLWPDDPQPVLGVAPTGRAATVMRSTAVFWHEGRPVAMDSSTIHRALKMAPGDEYSAFGHITRPMVITDESSMIDVRLMAALLSGTTAEHMVFLGDPKQLQPVGPGAPFRDMILSGVIPTVNLTHNFRTNCPGILALCSDISDGSISVSKLPIYLALGGVFHVPCDHAARPGLIASHYVDMIERGYSPTDIKVLSPHNDGEAGTHLINMSIRAELGLPPDELSSDDILVVTENNYHADTQPGFPQVSGDGDRDEIIFNGELCEASDIGPDFVDVRFDENCDGIRHVRMLLNDGSDAKGRLPDGVAFGRCMSVHRGQGSQFRVVIFPIEPGNDRFGIIQKSLVYTANSRPIDLLILIGKFDDFVDAAKTPDLPRYTLLRVLLERAQG